MAVLRPAVSRLHGLRRAGSEPRRSLRMAQTILEATTSLRMVAPIVGVGVGHDGDIPSVGAWICRGLSRWRAAASEGAESWAVCASCRAKSVAALAAASLSTPSDVGHGKVLEFFV
jgi:hypothetical protein